MTERFRLLAKVACDTPGAAEELGAWILGLSVRSHDADEVRQRTAIKLLTDAPRIVSWIVDRDPEFAARGLTPDKVAEFEDDELRHVERRFNGYVRQILRNEATNVWRVVRGDSSTDEISLSTRDALEPEPDHVAEAQEVLEAFHSILKELTPQMQTDLEQMEALKDRLIEMSELVALDLSERGLDPQDERERLASRERIYRRHGRTRLRLERQLLELRRTGQLPIAHGDRMLDWIRSMRRRIPKAPAVPDSGRAQ